MKGYETYAVLKGGEKVIQFSDNSDIVTDKEASAVEVVPKGKKGSNQVHSTRKE